MAKYIGLPDGTDPELGTGVGMFGGGWSGSLVLCTGSHAGWKMVAELL